MSDTGWIIACTVLVLTLAVAAFAALYVRLTRTHPGSHAVLKPARERRLPARVHRLGGVIGGLVERDPGPKRPPIASGLFEDAPSGTTEAGPDVRDAEDKQDGPREPVFIPAADEAPADVELPEDLDERIGAIEYPEPGEDLGPFFERVAKATSTRTGLEGTAGWDPEDVTEIAAAVKEDPALTAAIRAAEDYYAELDAGDEESMQRFKDAHREEVEAAGDTTEQDRRSYYENPVR